MRINLGPRRLIRGLLVLLTIFSVFLILELSEITDVTSFDNKIRASVEEEAEAEEPVEAEPAGEVADLATEEEAEAEEPATSVDVSYDGGYGTDGTYDVVGGESSVISVSGGYRTTEKTEFWRFPDDKIRLVKAENGVGASWSVLFREKRLDSDVSYYFPHPWEMRVQGTGTAIFEFFPDNTEGGYESIDLYNLGLAFWPTGNGTIRVSRDGTTWSESYELNSGSPGIDFPLEDGYFMVEITLNDEFAYFPLGEKVPSGDEPRW